MSAAQYVGRMGGLAVFFGIGTAVLMGAGTAAADDTGASGKPADAGRNHSATANRNASAKQSGAPAAAARGKATQRVTALPNASSTVASTDATAATDPVAATVPTAAASAVRTARAAVVSTRAAATAVAPRVISPPVNHAAFDLLGFLATAATNIEQALLSPFTQPTTLVGPSATPGVFTGEPSLLQQMYANFNGTLESQLSGGGNNSPFISVEPPWYFTVGLNVTTTQFEGMPVYVLQRTWAQSDKEVVYVHGGGYTSQPLIFQWLTVADMARQTGATIIAPIYPLGGQGGNAETIVPAIADLMTQTINERGADNVSVFGDSAGGGLALAAVQEQIRRGDPTPNSMVLLSPWLDVTLSDPRSLQINDPLLDAKDLINRGKLWAGGLDPTDPRVSPLFGSLAGLPPTTVYSGSMDLLSPDTLRLQEKAIADGAPITFGLRTDSIHCWGVFPFLPDAQADRPDIYAGLNLV